MSENVDLLKMIEERKRLIALHESLPAQIRDLELKIHQMIDHPLYSLLSPQQMKIHTLVRQGLSNKEVAAQMNVTERTIKFHMSEILRKLNKKNRREI